MNDIANQAEAEPPRQGESLLPASPDDFPKLAREWKQTRGPTSSAARMAKIPAYEKIIAMGKSAIPLILAELEREPDHWFIALHAITGADPVPKESRGRIKEMAAAWVRWGKENGIRW